MKCRKCGAENPIKADYCRSCGEKFSEEEQKQAYSSTIYGKIDRFLELKSWVTLSKFTDHFIVRALIVMGLAFLVLLNVRTNGKNLSIRENADYEIAYNSQLEEYYVLTELPEVNLSVYVPQKTSSLILEVYRGTELLESRSVDPSEDIVVQKNAEWHYKVNASYENGSAESMTFFVCRGEAAE